MNGVLAVFFDGKKGFDEMKKLKKMTDGATAPKLAELAAVVPLESNAIDDCVPDDKLWRETKSFVVCLQHPG